MEIAMVPQVSITIFLYCFKEKYKTKRDTKYPILGPLMLKYDQKRIFLKNYAYRMIKQEKDLIKIWK